MLTDFPWLASPALHYVPLALVTFVAIVVVARLFGWIDAPIGRAAHGSFTVQPSIALQPPAAPAERAPSLVGASRYTDAVVDVSIETLSGLFKGRTNVQGEKLLELYRGQRIVVSGAVFNVRVNDNRCRLYVLEANGKPLVAADFDLGWSPKVKVLEKGAPVRVRGIIDRADSMEVCLDACELLPVAS